MPGVLIRREEETQRQRHTGRKRPCDDGVIYWSDARTRQGIPRITSKYQKLEKAKSDSPLQVSEGTWLC